MSVKINISPEKDAKLIVEALRSPVAGLPRLRAIDLYRFTPFSASEKEKTYTALLRDTSELSRVRYLAAANLCKINQAGGGLEVLQVLEKDTDSTLVGELAWVLGRWLPVSALARVQALAARYRGHTRAQLDFALAMIAYREGLPEYGLPMPKDMVRLEDTPNAMPIKLTAPAEQDWASIRTANDDDDFGLRISRKLAYKIECQPNEWLLAFDTRMEKPDAVAGLFARKQVIGALFFRNFSNGDYSLAYLLLSSPDNKICRLHLCSPKGVVKYAGTITTTNGRSAGFSVQAVAQPGATAILFEGEFDEKGLSVALARSGSAKLMRKMPARR